MTRITRAHEELADALCRVASVYDEEQRRQLWWCLPAEVRARLNVAGPPYGFALSLVVQCCEQRWLGPMLRWLHRLEGGSEPAERACERAEGLLTAEEWQLSGPGRGRTAWERLRKALREVPYDERVADVYRAVDRRSAEEVTVPAPRDAWEAFLDLEELPLGPSGQEPPGERFLRLLARHVAEEGVVQAVRDWIPGGRSRGGAERAEAAAGRSPVRPQPPPRLVIKVEHDLGNVERFWIAHRLITAPGEDWMDVSEAEALTEVTAQELPRRVSELIAWAERQQAENHEKIRLEFIFPFSLLFRFIVQKWPLEVHRDAPSPSLGSQYEIVIRSEEFAHSPRAQRACRRRWENLRVGRGRVGSSSVVREQGWENVSDYLGNEDIVAFVAYALPGVEWREQVYAAVVGGVPVVAWRWTGRNGDPEAHFLSVLRGEEGTTRKEQEMKVREEGIKNLTRNLYRSRVDRGTAEQRDRSGQSYDLSVIYHDYQQEPQAQGQTLSGGNIR